jgi:hypothetical protein
MLSASFYNLDQQNKVYIYMYILYLLEMFSCVSASRRSVGNNKQNKYKCII